jgi:hypothetical protein
MNHLPMPPEELATAVPSGRTGVIGNLQVLRGLPVREMTDNSRNSFDDIAQRITIHDMFGSIGEHSNSQ